MCIRDSTSTVVPHGLHLDYGPDFQTWRVDDIAPTLTSPLLSSLIGNILQLERPGMPGEPAPFKADEDLWGSGRMPPKQEVSTPFQAKRSASRRPANQGEDRETEPPSSRESSHLEPGLEIPEIVISDDSTTEEPQGSSTPRSIQALTRKHLLEAWKSQSSPSSK